MSSDAVQKPFTCHLTPEMRVWLQSQIDGGYIDVKPDLAGTPVRQPSVSPDNTAIAQGSSSWRVNWPAVRKAGKTAVVGGSVLTTVAVLAIIGLVAVGVVKNPAVNVSATGGSALASSDVAVSVSVVNNRPSHILQSLIDSGLDKRLSRAPAPDGGPSERDRLDKLVAAISELEEKRGGDGD